jgi:hypothetical protein
VTSVNWRYRLRLNGLGGPILCQCTCNYLKPSYPFGSPAYHFQSFDWEIMNRAVAEQRASGQPLSPNGGTAAATGGTQAWGSLVNGNCATNQNVETVDTSLPITVDLTAQNIGAATGGEFFTKLYCGAEIL